LPVVIAHAHNHRALLAWIGLLTGQG